MVFALLFLVPVVIELVAFVFFEKEIRLKEFVIEIVAQAVVAGICAGVVYYKDIDDHEVWNGTVLKKAREKVSCEHSYSCNCVTVSCGKNCSTTVCQTCYEHDYDVDWAVYTTNGERLTIDRINRQGTDEPPRYDTVKIGEPTSLVHRFVNYIKASPDSLFRHQGLEEKFKQYIPGYPQNVYDYYRLDRLVLVNGATVDNLKDWNYELAQLNGKIGRQKQCNIISVFAKSLPQDYFYAVEQAWIGGKQNDVIVITGLDNANQISWVGIMAWSNNKLFEVKLRDDITDLKTIDREKYFQVVEQDVSKYFVRKHMSDFKYLKSSITPTKTEWIVSMIIGLVVAIGLCIFFFKYDIDEILRGY